MANGPEPGAGMIPGQSRSQARSGASGSSDVIKGGLLTLAGAVLPGYATGEPLADVQRALDMLDGGPPAFRARESSRLASN